MAKVLSVLHLEVFVPCTFLVPSFYVALTLVVVDVLTMLIRILNENVQVIDDDVPLFVPHPSD